MTPAALAPLASVSTCPSCGRPFRRAPQTPGPVALTAVVNTSRLSEVALYRHYRQTAPVEDLRFFLRHARLSPDLRADGDALLAIGCRDTGGTLSRSDWYRRLTGLQDRWRRETTGESQRNVPSLMAEAV